MNKYKMYCVNENRNLIVKGFDTDDKEQIKKESTEFLKKLYPNKKVFEGFKITSNPEKYFKLDPKNKSSWMNLNEEKIVNKLTNMIFESITEEYDITPDELRTVREAQQNLIDSFITQIKKINPKINDAQLENELLHMLSNTDVANEYDPVHDFKEKNPEISKRTSNPTSTPTPVRRRVANEDIEKHVRVAINEMLNEKWYDKWRAKGHNLAQGVRNISAVAKGDINSTKTRVDTKAYSDAKDKERAAIDYNKDVEKVKNELNVNWEKYIVPILAKYDLQKVASTGLRMMRSQIQKGFDQAKQNVVTANMDNYRKPQKTAEQPQAQTA